MPRTYICPNPAIYSGKVIDTGQCVAFVEAAAGAPTTPSWRSGAKVQGNLTIPPGTAIAIFDATGLYGNHTNGTSHAAIYMGQSSSGLFVWDQWKGQPVHQRVIRFKSPGDGMKVDNGIYFNVIETAE